MNVLTLIAKAVNFSRPKRENVWVPGHNNVPGNELANELARQAAASEFIGFEPVFGISSNTAQNTILSWASSGHRNLWQSADKQRCYSKALTSDSHVLRLASVGNICKSLLVYLLVMLLLTDI